MDSRLNLTRPDIVRSVHEAYFAVGVDCVETNTFGANFAALAEYDIPEQVHELSEAGARIARETADRFTVETGRQRWVLGSMGPGTKLPTLGHVAYGTIRDAYQAKFNDYPRLGSIVGYSAIKSLAEGMKKAGSTDTEKLVAAFKGLQVPTPFGPIVYRPEDNQSTMGGYVGRTKNEGGKGVMVNYRYVDGAKVQPSNDEVKKMRPAD